MYITAWIVLVKPSRLSSDATCKCEAFVHNVRQIDMETVLATTMSEITIMLIFKVRIEKSFRVR